MSRSDATAREKKSIIQTTERDVCIRVTVSVQRADMAIKKKRLMFRRNSKVHQTSLRQFARDNNV